MLCCYIFEYAYMYMNVYCTHVSVCYVYADVCVRVCVCVHCTWLNLQRLLAVMTTRRDRRS
jgi:hypothetical protein